METYKCTLYEKKSDRMDHVSKILILQITLIITLSRQIAGMNSHQTANLPNNCTYSNYRVDCSNRNIMSVPDEFPPFTKHMWVYHNTCCILNNENAANKIKLNTVLQSLVCVWISDQVKQFLSSVRVVLLRRIHFHISLFVYFIHDISNIKVVCFAELFKKYLFCRDHV